MRGGVERGRVAASGGERGGRGSPRGGVRAAGQDEDVRAFREGARGNGEPVRGVGGAGGVEDERQIGAGRGAAADGLRERDRRESAEEGLRAAVADEARRGTGGLAEGGERREEPREVVRGEAVQERALLARAGGVRGSLGRREGDGALGERLSGLEREAPPERQVGAVALVEPVVPGVGEAAREEGRKLGEGVVVQVLPPERGEAEERVGRVVAAAQAGARVEGAGPVAQPALDEDLEPRVPRRGEEERRGGEVRVRDRLPPGLARGGVVERVGVGRGGREVEYGVQGLGPDADALVLARGDELVLHREPRLRGGVPRARDGEVGQAHHVEAGEGEVAREKARGGAGLVERVGSGRGVGFGQPDPGGAGEGAGPVPGAQCVAGDRDELRLRRGGGDRRGREDDATQSGDEA